MNIVRSKLYKHISKQNEVFVKWHGKIAELLKFASNYTSITKTDEISTRTITKFNTEKVDFKRYLTDVSKSNSNWKTVYVKDKLIFEMVRSYISLINHCSENSNSNEGFIIELHKLVDEKGKSLKSMLEARISSGTYESSTLERYKAELKCVNQVLKNAEFHFEMFIKRNVDELVSLVTIDSLGDGSPPPAKKPKKNASPTYDNIKRSCNTYMSKKYEKILKETSSEGIVNTTLFKYYLHIALIEEQINGVQKRLEKNSSNETAKENLEDALQILNNVKRVHETLYALKDLKWREGNQLISEDIKESIEKSIELALDQPQNDVQGHHLTLALLVGFAKQIYDPKTDYSAFYLSSQTFLKFSDSDQLPCAPKLPPRINIKGLEMDMLSNLNLLEHITKLPIGNLDNLKEFLITDKVKPYINQLVALLTSMFTVQDDVSTQRLCASNGAAKIDSADGPAIRKGLKDYGIVKNTSDIIKAIYSISIREEIVQRKQKGSGAGPTDEMEF